MQNGRNRILCELYIFNVLGNILLRRKSITNLDSVLKSRNTTLLRKVKSMVFSVVKYRCRVGPQKRWVLKNWCFWTVGEPTLLVLEKTLESPLDNKEIQPVHPKGNQSWIFFGRTDAEAKTPVLWPPDVKNWVTGKDSDAGKDWRWGEKGMTEDEMVGWHHQLNGHEFQ